jgi:hypothetical protein
MSHRGKDWVTIEIGNWVDGSLLIHCYTITEALFGCFFLLFQGFMFICEDTTERTMR